MSEEKQEFKKFKEVTPDTLSGILKFGTINLNQMPNDCQFTAKILSAPEVKEYDFAGKPNTAYTFSVEYNRRMLEDSALFRVQVGGEAGRKFLDRYGDEEYVGKQAFFKKWLYQGKNCQAVYLITAEGFVDDSEVFKFKESIGIPQKLEGGHEEFILNSIEKPLIDEILKKVEEGLIEKDMIEADGLVKFFTAKGKALSPTRASVIVKNVFS